MRYGPIAVVALGIGLLLPCCGPIGMAANDTGGIIPWSPENQQAAFAIASEHCARYDKYARITSMAKQPGDYIGFACVWSPHARP